MSLKRNRNGFTLIELMIVVAIVAILSAVAYPSYVQYVVRSNRAAAQSFMLEVTSMEQRFLLDSRAYTTTLGAGGLGMSVPSSVAANYNVAVSSPTSTTFAITATPIAGSMQATKDTACGTLTITQDGTKSVSGSGGLATCWRQ